MASSVDDDVWHVVIVRDESKSFSFRGTETVANVKSKWATFTGEPTDTIVFLTSEDKVPDDSQMLTDLPRASKSRKCINLFLEEPVPVNVKIYGQEDVVNEQKTLSVLLSKKPSDIYPAISRLFEIPGGRLFQLRTERSPLDESVSFREQDVHENTQLLIDLGFEVRVKEPWEDTTEEYILYSTDKLDKLMPHDQTHPQRLMCGDRTVDTKNHLMDALKPFGDSDQFQFTLHHHVKADVTVRADNIFNDHLIWPTDKVSEILPKGTPKKQSLLYEGSRVSPSDVICKTTLPPFSLLLCDKPVSVPVRLGRNRLKVVHVPDFATVYDVKKELQETEKCGELILKRGHHVLSDEDPVAWLICSNANPVEAETKMETFTVTLSDRSMRWKATDVPMNFSGLVHELAKRSSLTYKQLKNRTLRCAGCDRKITKKEEDHQMIPAPCCRVRSLTLIEPKAGVDIGTQSATFRRRHRTSRVTTRAQEENEKVSESSATEWWRSRDMGTQTLHPKSSFRQQFPTPRSKLTSIGKIPRPFIIRDHTKGKKYIRDLDCDLDLADPVTVRNVREAVRAKCDIDFESLRLDRAVGDFEGKSVVLVCNENGKFDEPLTTKKSQFGDEEGNLYYRKRVKWDWRTLEDNKESFLIVPTDRKNTVSAHRKKK